MFAALGSFLFGYDSGVMTDVIASANFNAFFHTNSESPILGAIVSTFAGGACIGALSGGFTIDRLGRRISIQIGAVICVLGAILQAASQQLAMMLVGRIITGFAVGMMSMAVPIYQAELAHPKDRGFMVGLSQQMVGLGFVVSTWIGYGSAQAPDSSSLQWRFPLAFQSVPALMLAIGLIWFPESPRQLIEKDREDEAYSILRKLHFDGTNEDWLQQEFSEIRETIHREKQNTVRSWSVMFTVPVWRTRLMHGVAVQVFTQLTGINVINYYQTIMYEALGIEGNRNLLVTGIYNVIGPIANFFFIFFLIDRIGRKKPLIFGTIGITVLLVLEAILNSQNPDGDKRSFSIGGVAMIFMVTIVFSFSFGPCSWTYMSEVMPMQIRGQGNAFATGIGNWLVNVIFAQASPQGLGHLHWKYYFVFAAFNVAVTLPTIIFVFKETKGLTLEEIDGLFGEVPQIGGESKEIERKDGELHLEEHAEVKGV
ncbi:hypothetical protein RUND412_007139 [Rhizina undulata]